VKLAVYGMIIFFGNVSVLLQRYNSMFISETCVDPDEAPDP